MALFSRASSFLKIVLCATLSALITNCSTYDKTPAGGKFEGEARMVPVTPNTFFFYRPQDRDDVLFAYIPSAEGKYATRFKDGKITPDAMLTTGASVPRALWGYNGLSPFDYTRAALIHDWLFEAHHRYEFGEYLLKSGTDEAAKRKGERLVREYGPYKSITQDDASEIYAECIRSLMEETDRIQSDLKDLIAREPGKLTGPRLQELASSLDSSKKNKFRIWAHHWTTSTRCFIPKAKQMWMAQHDDLGVYEAIAESNHAVSSGYMSAWLQKKFRAIYRESKKGGESEQGKLAGVSQAVDAAVANLKQQDADGTLRPRVYLEVSDTRTQDILRARAAAFPNMDVKIDRNIQPDVRADELHVYYYRSEDGKEAAAVLNAVLGMLPPGGRPAGAKATMLKPDGLFRPRHYDLHVGSAVARSIGP